MFVPTPWTMPVPMPVLPVRPPQWRATSAERIGEAGQVVCSQAQAVMP